MINYDTIKDAIDVVYEVTATAIIAKGAYEGPMTPDAFREEMVRNPQRFTIEWKIVAVATSGGGLTLASNGEGE